MGLRRWRRNVEGYLRWQRGEYYSLFQYSDAQGGFDYERYREVQTEGNKRKIDNVFADERTIGEIAAWLEARGPVREGLCHGSRNGTEVRWFSESLPDARIVGTDISDSATRFDDVVQHDFHERRDEWVGRFDFVYTNSHDHAYDPKKAFDAWVEQLAPGGRLIIEHTDQHSDTATDTLDPFGVPPLLFPYFVLEIGKGRYWVEEIIGGRGEKPNGVGRWLYAIAAKTGSVET